jgi:tRNA-dihydrouridine synthase
MNYYFAPMEGITGYIYRNAHHKVFPGMTRYFSPFISPVAKKDMKTKEKNDILPEHNIDYELVPQILTNRSEDFIRIAKVLKNDYGYEEVNLNLGCPVRTVVSKKKGSGFLAYPRELNQFLAEIFDGLDMKISVKTRLGMSDSEEFDELLEIYNQYPLEELIVHARVQADYYKNTPNLEAFEKAVIGSKNPICYNGDLFSKEDISRIKERFPKVERLMLGRGLLTNPALLEEELTKQKFLEFYHLVYEGYQEIMPGDIHVLYKMKELWHYMGELFVDGKKELKKIKKATRLADYEAAVSVLVEKPFVE